MPVKQKSKAAAGGGVSPWIWRPGSTGSKFPPPVDGRISFQCSDAVGWATGRASGL